MSQRIWHRCCSPAARLALVFVVCALPGCGVLHGLDNTNAIDPAHAPVLREIEPIIATIPIRNPYDRAVKVKLLDPTCSCATLEMKNTFILPHQCQDLHIAVDNMSRSGPQHIGISVYLTDAEFDTIEASLLWSVRACVQVDDLAPGADPLARPADTAWRDVYKYVSKVRPDELGRLRKRIRLSSPKEEEPAGGLKITGIDYSGTLWAFTATAQSDGSVLVLALARNRDAGAKEGELDENVVIHTNHPDKPLIRLRFFTVVTKTAGSTSIDPTQK
jgi:hypothetical protein